MEGLSDGVVFRLSLYRGNTGVVFAGDEVSWWMGGVSMVTRIGGY